MAKYEITAPDGSVYEVTAPDDASEDQVLAYAQSNWKQQAPQAAPAAPQAAPATPQRQWSDVPGEAARNLAPSGARFFGNLYEAVTSPLQTIQSAGEVAGGAVRAGLRAIAPGLEAPGNESTKRQDEMASAAWRALKARYFGEEEIKRTLATDPVGALADLSSIATGGAGLAPKAATVAKLGKAAPVVSGLVKGTEFVGKWADPVQLAASGVSGLGKGASVAIREGLGGTTGAGGTAIGEAYRAGKAGGETAKTFRENMRGKADMTDVLESAREGVSNIRAERAEKYSQGMNQAMADQSRIPFAPIQASADQAVSSLFYKGKQLVSDAELRPVMEAKAIVDDFAKDPSLHNAPGLDALKRRLDSVYPESPMHSQAQRAITQMRNEVKGRIVAHSPEYSKVMDDFSESKRMQTEIEKTLSLGPNATADTTLRKLGSSMRNNVNANFGRRLDVLDELAQRGGVQLRPALAGQALNTFIPRGLQASAATVAGLVSPASIPYLAITSPRTVGEAAHAAGRVAGIVRTPRGGIDLLASGKRFGERLGLPQAIPKIRRARQPILNASQKLNSLAELEAARIEEERRRKQK